MSDIFHGLIMFRNLELLYVEKYSHVNKIITGLKNSIISCNSAKKICLGFLFGPSLSGKSVISLAFIFAGDACRHIWC